MRARANLYLRMENKQTQSNWQLLAISFFNALMHAHIYARP